MASLLVRFGFLELDQLRNASNAVPETSNQPIVGFARPQQECELLGLLSRPSPLLQPQQAQPQQAHEPGGIPSSLLDYRPGPGALRCLPGSTVPSGRCQLRACVARRRCAVRHAQRCTASSISVPVLLGGGH